MNRKRIVITGGGCGLGRALALEYAREGWRVALLDRDEARAQAVAAEVEQAGGKALALACDVTDEEAVAASATFIRRGWKGLDILVNNAGIAGSGTVVDTPAAHWREILEVNLFGVVSVCRAFVPAMNTIGRSLLISGDITSDEDLTIDGTVRGRVTVRNAALVIGLRADLEGDVRAPRVIIAGRVRGGVFASERIEVLASAAVHGNLSANRIVLADGARFDGGIDMARRTIAAKVAQFKAAAR